MKFPEETFYFFDLSHPLSIGKNYKWLHTPVQKKKKTKNLIQLEERELCLVDFLARRSFILLLLLLLLLLLPRLKIQKSTNE